MGVRFFNEDLKEELDNFLNITTRQTFTDNEFRSKPTSLKFINKRLNIKYTISGNEEIIKGFYYYINGVFRFCILCKGNAELKKALDFHNELPYCNDKKMLANLLKKYQSIITF